MTKKHQNLSFQRKSSLPGWFGAHRSQLRSVLRILFRVSCWSAVAWLVWNHALSGTLNSGGIGPWQSLGLGALLSAISKLFEDSDSGWDLETRAKEKGRTGRALESDLDVPRIGFWYNNFSGSKGRETTTMEN